MSRVQNILADLKPILDRKDLAIETQIQDMMSDKAPNGL